MKNQWLDKKNIYGEGFPSDDMNALQQMASGTYDVCWECWSCCFVEKETITQTEMRYGRHDSIEVNYTPMEFTPVMHGTFVGCVKLEGEHIQTFYMTSAGYFANMQYLKEDDTKPRLVDATLNHNTGELVGYWNVPVENSEIIVNYEYVRE